jgi:Cu/Ag efflux pump CusA
MLAVLLPVFSDAASKVVEVVAEYMQAESALRQDLVGIPGLTINIGQPISHHIDHMLSGTRASIGVKLFGPDLYKLRSLGEKVRQAMNIVPGLMNLSLDPQVDVPELRVQFDRQALARHGLHVHELDSALNAAIQGYHASTILESQNAFPLVVRLAVYPIRCSGAEDVCSARR